MTAPAALPCVRGGWRCILADPPAGAEEAA